MSLFDLPAQQLSSADSDIEIRKHAAIQLYDNIENYVSGPIYAKFLEKLAPIFINCLKGPPVFISTSPEQELRICVLKILSRLPTNTPGPFEPYAEEVVNLLIELVRVDNEENALLCIKMIMDIIQFQAEVLRDTFQPLLDLVQHMVDQLELVVRDQLAGSSQTHENAPRPGSSVASISDLGSGLPQQTLPLLRAMASFKVLAECPILAQSIFQAYQSSGSLDIKLFFLFTKRILVLQAKPQEQAHAAAAAEGMIFTGVSPNISNRAEFEEFIGIQAKTLSLHGDLLQESEEFIQLTESSLPLPDIVIRLLKDCPREKSDIRKELLTATRYITNSTFRRILLDKIDDLLDERILLGDGAGKTLRALAYSMLADLINHVRDALEPPQIRKIVEVYTTNLQDNFSTTNSTTSTKLLLNMAEWIAKIPNRVDARYYLIMILNAIGNKFVTMNREYPNAIKLSKLHAQQPIDASPNGYLADKKQLPDWDEIDIFTAMPIQTLIPRYGADPVADNKSLFATVINDLKNFFDLLKACWEDSSSGFTAEEVQVLGKLLRAGANVFRYYETDTPAAEPQYTSALEMIACRSIFGTNEGKDLLETFVAFLLYIDPPILYETFHDQIAPALARVSRMSEIFPTLVERYRLELSRAKDWVDPLILGTHIEDEWYEISPLLSAIDAVLETRDSTILAPLYSYCNCFPREACSLLLGKIEEQKYGRFLARILERPESGPLRKVVVENIEILIKKSGHAGAKEDTRYAALINYIPITRSLCKFEGERGWMDERGINIWFKTVGKDLEAHLRTNTLPPHLRLAAEQASEQLMVIFTNFLEYHPTDLDSLFSLIESVTNDDFRHTHPLFKFIYRHIICSNSIEFWKTVVMRSIEVYASKSVSQKYKTFLICNIVNPIIAMNFMRTSKQKGPKGPQLMDKAVIKSIHTKIWKVSLSNPNDDLTQPGIHFTRLEVLRLTAMLVKHYHRDFYNASQDIIKFAWTYTYLEDIICKHAANVVIGYCSAHYKTPDEIIRQVYVSLLEPRVDEDCALVTQGLDLIAPVLPEMCNATPDNRNPIWAAPRRVLIEERQNVMRITPVYSFLAKHAGLFYEYRDKFIIIIVKSLRTIAQPPNPTILSKNLVLKMMTLVWQWEQQRVEGKESLSTEKRKSEGLDKPEYEIPPEVRAEMISFLRQFIMSLKEPYPRQSATSLLDNLLDPQYWGDLAEQDGEYRDEVHEMTRKFARPTRLRRNGRPVGIFVYSEKKAEITM